MATTPMRQSCDRCHGQKLRCTRTGNREQTGACNRCLRQGAQCVYSSCLPKGRPSMYRTSSTSQAPASAPASAPSSAPPTQPPTPEQRRRQLPANIQTRTTDNSIPVSLGASAASAGASIGVGAGTTGGAKASPSLAAPLSTPSTSTSDFPWLTPPSWDDMQIDPSEHDSSNWPSEPHSMVYTQPDASSVFLGSAFPGLLSWDPAMHGDAEGMTRGRPPSPPASYHGGPGQGLVGFDFSESPISGSSSMAAAERDGPEACIAQLSQLSTRLSSLHRSTYAIFESIAGSLAGQPRDHGRPLPAPLIDDAAFRAVAGWLVFVSANMNISCKPNDRPRSAAGPGGSNKAGDTLHDAFSASQRLLDVLHSLQGDPASGTSTRATSRAASRAASRSTSASREGAQRDFRGGLGGGLSRRGSTWNSESPFDLVEGLAVNYTRPQSTNQYSNTAVRHLVVACQTLLLNIYIAILTALQHDADLWSSHVAAAGINATESANAAGAAESNGAPDAALADMRLVLVVQLCSYLIKRQHQAVEMYLSPSPSPLPPSSPRLSMSSCSSPLGIEFPLGYPPHHYHQNPPPTPPASSVASSAEREAMGELERDVQQRLLRLRNTLRI